MVSRWLLSGLLVFVSSTLFSQIFTEIRTGMSHREVTVGTGGCLTPPFCHYYDMVSWDDTSIKELAYRGHQDSQNGPVVEFLNCRIVYPVGYDSTRVEKYPMIVMLHGAGESGRIWTGSFNYATNDVRFDNNGINIYHGGEAHKNAVNRNSSLSNSFPGIVLWPQASYNGAWENGWDGGNLNPTGTMVTKVIEWLLINKNIDPDRVSTHGLSNGAKGTWDLVAKRPDLFAALLPMSGVGSDLNAMAPILNTTPIWLFQGGTDTNPRPQAAVDAIASLKAQGGAPLYTLYPTLGHGTWNTAYAEPNFFPWIKDQTKKNIYVFGGDPNICAGNNLKLGFSAGMLEYIWVKDDEEISSSNNRILTINQAGVYKVKYRRRFTPKSDTDWAESNTVTIGVNPSTFSPLLTNSGSITLPTVVLASTNPDVYVPLANDVYLTAPFGYPTYTWYKGGNLYTPLPPSPQSSTTTTNTVRISSNEGNASYTGDYTVKVLLPNGCPSAPSNEINVTYGSSGPPATTILPPPLAISPTEINIQWTGVPLATGYEVWRFRFGTVPYYGFQSYELVKVLAPDKTSFTDTGLRPEGSYRYRIRTVSAGGGTYSAESNPSTVTLADLIPPTTPSNLIASNITDTQVTLTWDPSLDNDKVYKYEIYNGSTLVNTITGGTEALTAPNTTVTLSGLAPNSWYLFNVRAIDYRNNYSPFAEGVEVTTQGAANGLNFNYYLTSSGLSGSGTSQLLEPGGFNFAQTPTQTGVISNFDISGAITFQGKPDPDNFVYSFDGYFQIDVAGNYRFYTDSDDGSRLYIDGTLVVNNDGAHGAGTPKTGVINGLSVGKHSIRVTFFENGGGQSLAVKYNYSTGGSPTNNFPNASTIPNTKLFQNSTTIVTYYLRTGTGSPHLTTSWTTDPNGGTGSSPANFTNALQYFVIANRSPSVSLLSGNLWTVSGNGSKVIVGKGAAIIFDINEAFTGKMDAAANATINVGHSTIPQFNVLDPTSTVNFNVSGTVGIPLANYGNVHLSSALYNLPVSNTSILGNLIMDNGVTTSGTANNLSTLRIGGNLTINNTSGNPFPANGPNQYALVFTGSKTHQVSFTTAVDPSLFSIQADFGDVVNFTGLSGRTFTLGSSQGGGLTLKGSAKLNLGNNNLVVTGRGTVNNNNETGALSMKGGDFTLTTTATQNNSLYFSAGDSVRNFTTSTPTANRVSILSTVKVNNLVTVSSGELNAGEGYLVLRSWSDAANGTARIGPLLNGAKVTGKINAQRYMSGEGRIYRYISSPVKGITAATLQNYFPITGNFADSSWGPGLLANASMFHYVETANPKYQPFPAINNLDTLRRGKGYTPFIREATDSIVMQFIGEPYQGTVPFTLTGGTGDPNDGWNLLGNPYAAPIQWTNGTTGGWSSIGGINTIAYVRENSNGETSVQTFGAGWDGVIAPGQAFWIRTTTGSPSLSISEVSKKTTDGAFFREGEEENKLKIIMTSAAHEDIAVIKFLEGATTAFDTNIDGVKQNNSYFNVSTLTSDNKPMVINLTTPNYCAQEIKLRIENAAVGTYGLSINGLSSLISGDKVTLIDTFLQTEKVLGESENLSFTITSDAASKADGRFTLRFEKPEVVLNQILKSSPACEQSNAIVLVGNSQPGVSYQAFFNGAPVTEALTSTGGTLEIPVNSALVGFGTTTLQVKGGFKGCDAFDLPMQIAVTRDTLPMPAIIIEPTRLIATTENATYQWYLNGEMMAGETKRELFAPENGVYEVEVSLSSCSKKSAAREYSITGIEKITRLKQLYPNPTKGKVIIEMEQPIDFTSMRIITTVGQSLPASATRLSAESAEVDFSNLPTGLYLLQVNGQRYRVLRE